MQNSQIIDFESEQRAGCTPEEFTENEPVDAVSGDIEALGEQVTKSRGVEHRARRENSVFRQTAELPCDPGHDVARVRDDDNDSVWAVLDQFRDDAFEDFDVLLHQVKTCLTFLLTRSGCDDDHSRILQPLVPQPKTPVVIIIVNNFGYVTFCSPSFYILDKGTVALYGADCYLTVGLNDDIVQDGRIKV